MMQRHISTLRAALRDSNRRPYRLRSGFPTPLSNDSFNPDTIGQEDSDFHQKPQVSSSSNTTQWHLFTTADFSLANLLGSTTSSGFESETWAPSVSIEHRIADHLTFGLATSYLHSDQTHQPRTTASNPMTRHLHLPLL